MIRLDRPTRQELLNVLLFVLLLFSPELICTDGQSTLNTPAFNHPHGFYMSNMIPRLIPASRVCMDLGSRGIVIMRMIIHSPPGHSTFFEILCFGFFSSSDFPNLWQPWKLFWRNLRRHSDPSCALFCHTSPHLPFMMLMACTTVDSSQFVRSLNDSVRSLNVSYRISILLLEPRLVPRSWVYFGQGGIEVMQVGMPEPSTHESSATCASLARSVTWCTCLLFRPLNLNLNLNLDLFQRIRRHF